MDKKQVIAFFDELAAQWDDDTVRNEQIISEILDKGGIHSESRVLDVACGTGVLFPDYNKRGALVTAIDISPEMVKICKEKFPQINVVCGDAESHCFETSFDTVMIYNAFPHFGNPDRLTKNLAKHIVKGGRITVAHGMSMEELEKCHSGAAKKVSLPLPEKEKLAEIMAPYFDVDVMISDDKMYIVSGVKR